MTMLHSFVSQNFIDISSHTCFVFRFIGWNITCMWMLLVLDDGRQIVVLRGLVASRILMRRRMSHCGGFSFFQSFVYLLINWRRQVFLGRSQSKRSVSYKEEFKVKCIVFTVTACLSWRDVGCDIVLFIVHWTLCQMVDSVWWWEVLLGVQYI